MDTKRLQQLRTVMETENLRQAAELLHMTHAGLSKSLRTLEDELGMRFFQREGRGIRVRRETRAILAAIEDCLRAERGLKAAAKGQAFHASDAVRIGTFEVFSTHFCPLLLEEFPERTRLSFHELIPGKLEAAIANDEVDFGITYLPIPHADVEHIQVNRIRMGVFGHRRFQAASLKFADLPFIVPISPIDGAPTRVRGLDGWPDDRIPRERLFEVELLETALSLARRGRGVAYLPRFVVNLHNQVVKAEFRLEELDSPHKIKSEHPVYALKRKDREEDALFRALSRAIRKIER